MDRNNYTFIETFCGAGGLALGLIRSGFELEWAFDNDEKAVMTFSKNVSQKVDKRDINHISVEEVLQKTGLKPGELTLLSGGPPCQGFSRQKHKSKKKDRRNHLILKYIRLVKGLNPKFILVENVDTFQKKRGTRYIKILRRFLQLNYELLVYEVNFADYGVPQIRKRTIIVGYRKDLDINYTFPLPTHKNRWVSVWEAIGHLDSPPEDGSEHPRIPNHYVPNISDLNRERIRYVPQGSGRKCLPKRLQLPCHRKKTGWPDVYGRMSMNRPAPTITCGFDNFTRGRFAHPLHDRPITPREAAILQGFETDFVFYGNKGEIRNQIGNAVPPIIGYVLGKSIMEALVTKEKCMVPV
ncbi:DNA (cytosine-5)-methyltransferase 1 [Caldalkalibacillus uzonensis]|uniref:DNA (cytosine-5-)-methyltransferase n=1 Tax=Caldalkalibacillus uzonensis TaxID=353224 RepID=A0ABU0CYC0_9BACI|nr:DNA cytosine methyltransferase [Caldalkalibacillus uzonensis]MDQ0341148.1 DNA (cytosine-5)-methyltransferase 1 [Caldalkalibacillus uzonensis]